MRRVAFTANFERHLAAPTVDVAGSTVREVLEAVFAANPRLRGYVLDDQGVDRRHIAATAAIRLTYCAADCHSDMHKNWCSATRSKLISQASDWYSGARQGRFGSLKIRAIPGFRSRHICRRCMWCDSCGHDLGLRKSASSRTSMNLYSMLVHSINIAPLRYSST